MRGRVLLLLGALVFVLLVPVAQAGIIRYAGKQVAQGANSTSQVVAAGGAALAGGTVYAGQTAASAARGGVSAAGNKVAVAAGGVAAAGTATGHFVANGAQTLGRKVWHVLW